jgi:hypothetical protein
MQVGTLEMDAFSHPIDMKGDFIQAVTVVVARMTDHTFRFEDWFDNDDTRKLACYSLSNEDIARWIENPFTVVPNAAWPVALVVAPT